MVLSLACVQSSNALFYFRPVGAKYIMTLCGNCHNAYVNIMVADKHRCLDLFIVFRVYWGIDKRSLMCMATFHQGSLHVETSIPGGTIGPRSIYVIVLVLLKVLPVAFYLTQCSVQSVRLIADRYSLA